ncbi:otu-like cysteine protease [Diplogelasinospora grovesii]|uniref:Otu-like cysteine protease n=1 Tax=Diplogelasinospora grovesii TaxID=303347 RepID=A0AAN6NHC0_9PEZI|nr:otu-like cysteine protease [Diplogelasinospora grovesii]
MEGTTESLEQMQARHRKEQKELQSRVTNKKKNATKKTRKGVNDECAELERRLKERQAEEIRELTGAADGADQEEPQEPESTQETQDEPAGQEQDMNGVATQLQNTSISKDEPNSVGSGGGKKRNRQKERLARRAAEVEAAAEAASQEAANMTDHRKLERTYMLKEFETHKLQETEIAPDGHCLFAAVADQLSSHNIPLISTSVLPTDIRIKEPYKLVRRTAADYMEQHSDDFSPFLEEPLQQYVSKIRDTAEWGGQLELTALANAYGVEIKVVQDGRTETMAPTNHTSSEGGVKTLWLAYYRHGYGLGEHYNSLRTQQPSS